MNESGSSEGKLPKNDSDQVEIGNKKRRRSFFSGSKIPRSQRLTKRLQVERQGIITC